MTKLSRRRFLAHSGAGFAALPAADALRGGPASSGGTRKFYTVLSLDRLGLKSTFQQSVELAHKYGFEAVDPDDGLFGAALGSGPEASDRRSGLKKPEVGRGGIARRVPQRRSYIQRGLEETAGGGEGSRKGRRLAGEHLGSPL